MNILFLGDVVGKAGCQAVIEKLDAIKKQYEIDFTIINGENSANGKGITEGIYHQLIKAGADVITLGNHAFSKHEIIHKLNQCPNMIHPINIVSLRKGNGYIITKVKDKQVAVVNVMGRAFMKDTTEGPIEALQKVLPKVDADITVIDLHAEATAEKYMTFFQYAKDVTAIIGTHTHIQTADEKIYEGCAYITDVGMCGVELSVLGRDKDEVIDHFIYKKKTQFKQAEGDVVICGCVIHVDEDTNRAYDITRFQVR